MKNYQSCLLIGSSAAVFIPDRDEFDTPGADEWHFNRSDHQNAETEPTSFKNIPTSRVTELTFKPSLQNPTEILATQKKTLQQTGCEAQKGEMSLRNMWQKHGQSKALRLSSQHFILTQDKGGNGNI